jgi:hypothetical protein
LDLREPGIDCRLAGTVGDNRQAGFATACPSNIIAGDLLRRSAEKRRPPPLWGGL